MPKGNRPIGETLHEAIVQAAGVLLLTVREEDGGRRPQRFLLLRHPDRWDLPKGHCDLGETLLQTAMRELHEETGISASDVAIDPTFRCRLEYPVRDPRSGIERTKQTTYFLGLLKKQPDLRLTEHESAEWRTWSPPHRIQQQTIDQVLAAAEAFLRSDRS